MKIAVLGGTGKMGMAISKQLSRSNQVIIGSRDPARAREAAKGIKGAVGAGYADAAEKAEAAIIAVPYSAMSSASGLAKELSGKLVISVVNPLKSQGGVLVSAPMGGSAAQELAKLLPGSRVATAFNNIPSVFFEGGAEVPMDVLVAADSRDAYEEAAKLVSSIPNLRPLYAGPLSQAEIVEKITALVVNLARLNGTGSLGTRFVSTEG